MPDQVRKRPYVWVTWLTKLLAEEELCWYKAWYKARHRYEKTADDPEREDFFREWQEKHDRLTAARVEELRADGWVTKVEDEASFKLQGAAADVAGKPDVVGMRDGEAVVVDAKSGRRRESDHWQVLIYLFALPLSWLGAQIKLRGEVQYADGAEPVRPLGARERDAIVDAVKMVSSPHPPPAKPSAFECKRCDVAGCAFRHKVAEGDARRFF